MSSHNFGEMDKELGASASGLLVKEEPSDETVILEKEEQSSTTNLPTKKRRWDDTGKVEEEVQRSNSSNGSPNLTPRKKTERTFKCPDRNCGQLLAISDFKSHFDFQHKGLERYEQERGKELLLFAKWDWLKGWDNKCLGIILIKPTVDNAIQETASTQDSYERIWIMISDKIYEDEIKQHVMIWLFSENENTKCSLRITHEQLGDESTECCVNSMEEGQNVKGVRDSLKCLRIPYRRFLSMLFKFTKETALSIIIH